MKTTFGFIGCGNMGGALAKATLNAVGCNNVYVADLDVEKANEFALENGINISTNEEIASTCDYIFLGVKPQGMETMLKGIQTQLVNRKNEFILVSMAAGLSINSIEEMAGSKDYPVIRIMPNMPASIGDGMILYCCNKNVDTKKEETFLSAFSRAGVLDKLDEKLIDAASALSGCGPAFAFMFIEALSDGAVECGLPRDKALLYAAQTVLGSAKLALESDKHPGELKDAVCSPGGTTIAGVHTLEEGGFRANAMNAVIKAYERTLELKK